MATKDTISKETFMGLFLKHLMEMSDLDFDQLIEGMKVFRQLTVGVQSKQV